MSKWKYKEYVPEGVSLNGVEFLITDENNKDVALTLKEKDARLIATAPEMYEKLSDFTDNIESFLTVYDDSSIFYDEFHQLVKSTKELLSKIDGEKEND